MRQRSETLLKLVCVVAVALLLYEVARSVSRGNPLANVKIPQVPTLAATNSPGASPSSKPTNSVPVAKAGDSTNLARSIQDTNARTAVAMTNTLTVSNQIAASAAPVGTSFTSSPPNLDASQPSKPRSGANPTNVTAVASNQPPTIATTNARTASLRSGPGGPPGSMTMPPGMGAGPGRPAELPKTVKARVDRIFDSEILAPAMRPLPMALLGILGDDVFLRTTTGQTGLVKKGDTLGGVKVLQIGINRVLVEEDGQQKELTIFSGIGGETLMAAGPTTPKETAATNAATSTASTTTNATAAPISATKTNLP